MTVYKALFTSASETRTASINAVDTATARATAETLRRDGESVRIYADIYTFNATEIYSGALTVVKRTTAKMISREGATLQFNLYNQARNPIIYTALVNPSECDPVIYTEYADVLEMCQVAATALIESATDGNPLDECYHRAYLALNTYLRSMKNINLSVTAQRELYIEDINGDIIAVNQSIGHIVADDGKLVDYTFERVDTDSARDIILDILSALKPTARLVLKYLARGYSERQVASAMRRAPSTIHEHVERIHAVARTMYPDGYKWLIY